MFHVKHSKVRFDSLHLYCSNRATNNKSKEKENKTMARKPMVTRTIVTTKVNVLCLNLTTCEPFNLDLILPRTYKDDKALMKKVSEQVDNEEQKAVHITAKEEVETVYGMTEQDFIEHAVELDPETRKAIEQDTEN